VKPITKAKSGDIVCADRGFYRHYGVKDGNEVIDLSPGNGDNSLHNKRTAHVRKRPLESFLKNNPGYVDNSPGLHSRKQTLKRAREEIGTGRGSYDLVFNNCEHKAREWQTGQKQSRQVDNAVVIAGRIVSEIIGMFD